MTSRQNHLRPPWATESSVHENCTSCGQCIAACPEGILIQGPAKTPIVSFKTNACTFCRKCLEVCPEPVFDAADQTPWNIVARVEPACLLNDGIGCQLCTDACLEGALKIDLSFRPMGRIVVTEDACTGCGACVSFCPQDAIKIKEAVRVNANG